MTPEQRLVAIGDLSTALTGAATALDLALAGAVALDRGSALPHHHAEGTEYLAQHLAELVEGVAALAQDRPPRWIIGMTFRDVPPCEPAP